MKNVTAGSATISRDLLCLVKINPYRVSILLKQVKKISAAQERERFVCSELIRIRAVISRRNENSFVSAFV